MKNENYYVFHDELHPRSWRKLLAAKTLLILILLTQPAFAAALRVNDFTFSHLGLADGLNSQRIYSLKQTDDGAVWLTTQSFVARYNGVSIENFKLWGNTCEYNYFVQSADNSVLQVFDASGNIYEYNPVQNHFDVVADVAAFFKHNNQLNDVYKDGDTYWLAMSGGVYMLRNGKIVTVGSKVYASCIIRGPKDILLFGTRQGVKSLSRNHKALVPYLPYDVVSGHYDADTKQLWLGTYEQGLILVDRNGVCTSMAGIPHHPAFAALSTMTVIRCWWGLTASACIRLHAYPQLKIKPHCCSMPMRESMACFTAMAFTQCLLMPGKTYS